MPLEQLLDEIEARDGAPAGVGTDVALANAAPGSGAGDALSAWLSSPQAAQTIKLLPSLMTLLGKGSAGESGASTPDAAALMCALRPYLSERRRSVLDGMLQLHRLRGVLRSVSAGEAAQQRR